MKHVGDDIQAYVAGELTDTAEQAVTEHLATCPACAHQAGQARQLWEQLGEVAIPPHLPASTAWPAIQARTFGRGDGVLLSAGGRWAKTGIAVTALAAGMALAVLLPLGNGSNIAATSAADETWGSSFWLEDEADSSFSALWLAAADQESGT